jgi:uncharacterized protein YndB with AHSA1/START domain
MSDLPAKDLPAYVLERAFDAPRELVWKAWTDPKLLPRWYGPNAETIVHRLDLKPGGLWLVEMKWGGKSNHQRVEYKEVTPPERLVAALQFGCELERHPISHDAGLAAGAADDGDV